MKSRRPFFCIAVILLLSFSIHEILRGQSQTDSVAFRLFNKADSLRRAQEFDSAGFYFMKSGILFSEQGLNKEYLEALVETAFICSFKNLTDSANTLIELAIEKVPQLEDDSSKILIDCYSLKARILCNYSDFTEATRYMMKAVQLCEEYYGYNHIRTSSAYGNFGIVYYEAGDFRKSISYYKKALRIVMELYGEDHHLMAAGYNNLGNVYIDLGKLDSASVMHEKALAIRLKVLGEYDLNTAASYTNLCVIYYERGDYQKALNYERSVFTIRKTVLGEEHPLTAMCYNNFGAIYEAIGDYEKALENHHRALSIREKSLPSNHPDIAMSYMNLANVYRHFNEFDKALDYHNRSYAIKKSIYGDYHPDIAQVLNNMGDIYFRMEDYRRAILKFDEAIHSLRHCFANYIHPDIAVYANNKAESYNELNELDSALFYVDYALQANRRIIENDDGVLDTIVLDYKMYLLSLQLKAMIFFHRYYRDNSKIDDLEKSVIVYKLAVNFTEQMRRSYTAEESKEYLSEKHANLFSDAINTAYIYFKASRDSTVLETIHNLMERSKQGILRDVLMKNDLAKNVGIPDSLRMKEKELISTIRAYKSELIELEEKNDTTKDLIATRELYTRLFSVEKEYDDLQSLYALNYPKFNQLIPVNKLPSLKTVCELRDSNEVVISYNISDTSLYISLFENKYHYLFRQTIGTAFEKSIHDYLRSVKTYDFDTYRQTNSFLYGLLVAPIEERISNIKHAIIIPDKALYYLPYETLFTEIDSEKDLVFSDLNYLIKRFPVSYRYTASTLLNDSGKRPVHKSSYDGFVGFAPVFDSDSSNNSLIIQGTPIADALTNDEIALRSVSIDGLTFNELNFSKDEVREIISLFRNMDLPASAYLYSMANEEIFKKESGKYKYIHIATHGMINENHPDLSGLIFSQSGKNSETNRTEQADKAMSGTDGVLYASEIYGLDLNADLVVLSACETGTGKMVKGEGIISITRGFLCSGVPNILFSLWKVGDKSTRELMVLFYSNLLQGKSYSEALQEAKLEMIKSKNHAYPLFWGGFTLIDTD
ncbi:MAG: CHAT domain-containing protein [Bacteroidales bacterium]|nr:CHAT domain-containing protein [Bacteroidales bacterium]